MKLIGIPAHNEEGTIASVILKSERVCDLVIVMNDGSTDETLNIMSLFNIDIITRVKNHGYGASLKQLFKKSLEYDDPILVTLDSDGQHDPSEAHTLYDPILEGKADVVIGSRFLGINSDMSTSRKLAIQGLTSLTNTVSNLNITDSQSGYRAYNKKALEIVQGITQKGMGASLEILELIGSTELRVMEVPIHCTYSDDEKGSSWFHGIDVFGGLIQAIVTRGAKWILVLSVIMGIIGALFGSWAINIYIHQNYLVPNITLLAISFILMAQLMAFMSITFFVLSRVTEKQQQ